ncbi:AAA family ATPase [Methylobacter psychrophilus]|uniref:AAA family ATPase n=1 Tax=Methylobacter psychrophilus TaxID=96941 RepID=UPI0021D4D4CB|nr:helicase RepA family protein [Methylobacter psychrophilus]
MKNNEILLTSGHGKFHTNEPDPAKPNKKLTPYDGIIWPEIQRMMDAPQRVEKENALWVIPSTKPSRCYKEQEQNGTFYFCWGDIDGTKLTQDDKEYAQYIKKYDHPLPSLFEIEQRVKIILNGCDYEIYTSKGATLEKQKARVLILLKEPLGGQDWRIVQEILNDKLAAQLIKPDRATERAAQLCYLPNRGEFYETRRQRKGVFFNPLKSFAKEISAKRNELLTQQSELDRAKQLATEKRIELSLGNSPNIIEAFNQCYTVDEWLLKAGYDQRGNSFRHPQSESGSYSASVKDGRVHTLSSNDPLFTNGKGAHDSFSCFTVLIHGGDKKAALKDAGDNLLTIGSVSYNKAVQIEYAKKNSPENLAKQKADMPGTIKEKFAKMKEAEPESKSGWRESDPAPAKQKEILPFKFAEVSELMNRPYKPDFLIHSLYELYALGLIFGETSAGKSFVVLDMAYCIATGISYYGLETKQGNVAYICGEGFRAIGRRVKALQNKYSGDIKGHLFISEQPGAFIDIGVTSAVAESIAAIGNINLVIIDTYHRNMGGGNENSADDFGAILRNIDTFLRPLNVTVLIVHHSGHLEKDRSRGSSSIRAAMDFEFQVSKSNNTVTLKPTKIKDGTTPPPMYFSLVDSEIGKDIHGNPIFSAFLEHTDKSEATKCTHRKLSARDDAILQTLNDAITRHGIKPTEEIKIKYGSFPLSQKIVHVEHWRELAYKTITVECNGSESKPQALKKAFKRSRDKLFNDKYIIEHGDYAWRMHEEPKC